MKRFVGLVLFALILGVSSNAFAQFGNPPNEDGGFLRLGVKKVLAEPSNEGLVKRWKPGFEFGLGDVHFATLVISGYFDKDFAVGTIGVDTGLGVKVGSAALKIGAGYSFSNNDHSANLYYLSLPLNIKNLYVNSKVGFWKKYADVSIGWQFGDK